MSKAKAIIAAIFIVQPFCYGHGQLSSGGAYSLRRAFQHIGILSLEFHVDKLSRPLL